MFYPSLRTRPFSHGQFICWLISTNDPYRIHQMRNMSFALTERQYLDGSKDVTRRLGWKNLKAGEKFRAVRKGMGLKKGEKVHVLGVSECVANKSEPLKNITYVDVVREGFPSLSQDEFIEFFCKTHKGCTPDTMVQRIVFTNPNRRNVTR